MASVMQGLLPLPNGGVDIVQQQRAERLLQFNDSQCWCARHRKGAHATGQEPEERNAGSKLSRAQKRPP